jgi:molybdopterin-containing oxidoreductase family iron-sulfur binding subunit
MARTKRGGFEAVSWEKAFSLIGEALKVSASQRDKSVYLSGRTTGTLSQLIDIFCNKLAIERPPEFEVYSHSQLKEANHILFGEKDVPFYRIEKSDFLLTVGADIIETFLSPVSFAHQLSRAKQNAGFQWYHVDPHCSLTGANADRRFLIDPMKERYLLIYLLWELLEKRVPVSRLPQGVAEALLRLSEPEASRVTGITGAGLKEIAHHFATAKRPLLITGGISTAHQGGLEVAALTGLIQWMMGEAGNLIDFSRAENFGRVGDYRDMERLSARLEKGDVEVIFISRTNPVFTLPPDYAFKENLKKARFSVGIGDFLDETLKETELILPLSHSIEAWGDAEPRKGVRSLIKPVMKNFHNTFSEGDMLLQLIEIVSGEGLADSYRDYLFNIWSDRYSDEGREKFLEKGYFEEAPATRKFVLDNKATVAFFKEKRLIEEMRKPLLILAPSIRTFDGRSRVLPLLSEIPDPLTTISYGRWISVSEETARKSQLRDGDEVTIATSDWSEVLPVKVQPGLAEGIFVIHRDTFDSLPLRIEKDTGGSIDYLGPIEITKKGIKASIPILSGSFSQMGRGIIPDPVHRDESHHERKTLYPEHAHEDYQWAMVIDLELCIGCAACVAACYIENNVPVVGKRDHLKGREMSWLRIEPFYDKSERVEFIPMLCQHCHFAPCEPVCPVYAAYHNPEGLNIQLYNRCVGTRYCSNNCPYKVRRFNWFWHRWKKPLNRMLNPDISVRGAGVMEKCTFCIQRIRSAKDMAKDESRKVRDGEVITACAQSCPTGAIVFGNILDGESRVYRLAHSGRAYRVFESLGTEPSVYYLSKRAGSKGRQEA